MKLLYQTCGRLPTCLVLAGILACPATLAQSPPPPYDELLQSLYETLGGDDWHQSDGWLDPEVHWCDWHGVACRDEDDSGELELYALDLDDNNLSGEITPELAGMLSGEAAPYGRLDLSHNAIEGALHELPVATGWVRLDFNRFDGELPALDSEVNAEAVAFLELNNNRFEGQVPSSWEQLQVAELDLSGNRLEGNVEAAFKALDPEWSQLVDLSDNAFSGALPAWITQLPLEPPFPHLGSINICWTDLAVADQETRDWLIERHVGGADFESCTARTRNSIGPEVSGSWYDPARSGEGFTLMLLEDGTPLVYWFTHLMRSRQMWLIGSGQHDDTTLFFDDLLRTRGRFGQGFNNLDNNVSRKGEQRMDGVPDDRLHLASRIAYNSTEYNLSTSGIVIFMPNPVDARTDLVRLSELAGTTCDNQSEFQQYSGAWYNPDRAGEGFIIEVLPDDRAVVYWFTYQPDESGQQAWMIGQSHIGAGTETCLAPGCEPVDALIEIDEVLLPVDTGHSFPADVSGIENIDWGELRLSFGGEGNGSAWFESHLEGYGSDEYDIERLARPMLAECEEQ